MSRDCGWRVNLANVGPEPHKLSLRAGGPSKFDGEVRPKVFKRNDYGSRWQLRHVANVYRWPYYRLPKRLSRTTLHMFAPHDTVEAQEEKPT
jgi:hypothetical protein